MALLGLREMSALSLQSGPQRTLIAVTARRRAVLDADALGRLNPRAQGLRIWIRTLTRCAAMPAEIVFHDLRDFRHCYWAEWPEARMGRRFRVSRTAIRRIIREQGPLRLDRNRFLRRRALVRWCK